MGLRKVCAIAVVVAAVAAPVCAQQLRFDAMRPGQREFSFFTGYGENHRIPASMTERFSFDLVKVRYGRFVSPRTETALELCAGNQLARGDNFALSAIVSYRRNFMARGGVALGYDLGFGLIHFTDAVEGQATRTNFTEQVGLVFQFATGPASAFTIDYRFCHASNAGLRQPNVGINTSVLSMGYTWYR